MGKSLYSKPFFTKKAQFGIDVSDDDSKVYFKISDLPPQNVVWNQSERKKHQSTIAAEVHEIMNIADGLRLFRKQGYEKFCEFAKWINPTGFAGTLMFFHNNADASVSSSWGISIKENPDSKKRESVPYIVSFSINQNSDEVGKVGRSFPIDPLIFRKFEDLCQRAATTAHDNELEIQVLKRKENYNKHQNGQSGKGRSIQPPPGM